MSSERDAGRRTVESPATSPDGVTTAPQSGTVTVLMSWVGALISVLLMAGIGYWAVSLGTRDRTEIPVIRAMEGYARTKPIDPGGLEIDNTDLSINAVVEASVTTDAADTVVLAPRPMPLDSDDLSEDQRIGRTPRDDHPADVVATLIAGDEATLGPEPVTGMEATAQSAFVLPEEMLSVLAEPEPIQRPKPRPVGLKPTVQVAGVLSVNLGSFSSQRAAELGRQRLASDHADLIGSRRILIQTTQSDGRTLYRVAAIGFESQVDSHNLCTALLERGTPCAPAQFR
ncbi:MAG: SPOR domain-containing protein [Paracoccaceae bacterium]|nr:SPOR domain-containing protein [Paracoccaceae bacterium]MDE2911620.1 SPOR domain-containing protein [Paracoccaceae bacterium]